MKKCSTSDDAFEIFSNINNGGKGLKKDEVMKCNMNIYEKYVSVYLNKYRIARNNGLSLTQLGVLNPGIFNQRYIYPGQKIRVK